MIRKTLVSLAIAAAAFGVQAEDMSKSALSEKFQSLTPFKIKAVEDAPLADFYQLVTDKGVFYISKDGEHIVSGSVHEAKNGLPNLTKQRIQEESRKALTELKDSFVTFEAPNEKYEIVVFYDASCGYCQKLHGEMSQLNAKGVTVHYAGWPRMGVESRRDPNSYSSGYKDLQNLWCAESPKAAFDRSVEGAYVQEAACETKIEQHFALGEQMGVRGTPAIYSIKGEQVTRGYAPAQKIVSNLEGLK